MRKKKADPIKEGQVYITDLQLAERFDVSRPTIWRWQKNGDLPTPYKFNGSTRWKIDDIKEMEEKLKNLSDNGKKFIPDAKLPKKDDEEKKVGNFGLTIVHLETELYSLEKTMEENLQARKTLFQKIMILDKSIAESKKKIESFREAVSLIKKENSCF